MTCLDNIDDNVMSEVHDQDSQPEVLTPYTSPSSVVGMDIEYPPPPPMPGVHGVTSIKFDKNSMLRPDLFSEIQNLLFVSFTIDGACKSDGGNKQIPGFTSDFLHAQLAGHTVWLQPPFRVRVVKRMLRHYFQCKQLNPEYTSLCIVLPVWQGSQWHDLIRDMQIVKEYPAGTPVFTAGGIDLLRQPWPVRVYYDAPSKPQMPVQPSIAVLCPVAMRLAVKISGARGVAAPDSQASHCFISKEYAALHGLCISSASSTAVQLANQTACVTEGTCAVEVKLGKCAQLHTINAYVLPALMPGVDIILGQDWLEEHRVKLDFESMTCIVDGLAVQPVFSDQVAVPTPAQAICFCTPLLYAATTVPTLTGKQAKKAIRKGAKATLLFVREREEGQVTVTPQASGQPMFVCSTQVGEGSGKGLVPQEQLDQFLAEYMDVFRELHDESQGAGRPQGMGGRHAQERVYSPKQVTFWCPSSIRREARWLPSTGGRLSGN